MKSSLSKKPTKQQTRYSSFHPLLPLQNTQRINPRRVTFQDTPEISVYQLSNKSILKSQLTNQTIIPPQKYSESQKLIDELTQLKQTLKNGRNSRKQILQQIQKTQQKFEKENHNFFNSTPKESLNNKLQDKATDVLWDSDSEKKTVIADSFLGSFRAVFTFYVELYFQKMTLALHLKKNYLSVFTYLLKLLDYKVQFEQTSVQIDDLCLAIYRLIKNKNADYKFINIKYGLRNVVQDKSVWKASDFSFIFQTIEQHYYLSNPSKFLLSMSFEELVKAFFQVLAQFADTQIKFKKICKANEKKLTSLLAELSTNYQLNLKLLAEFLYFDVQNSRKWLIMRFEEYFKDHFGTSDNVINLLKWLKQKK